MTPQEAFMTGLKTRLAVEAARNTLWTPELAKTAERMVKEATVKSGGTAGFLGLEALGDIAMGGGLGTVALAGIGVPLALSYALPYGLGYLGGTAAEKLFGPDEAAVEAMRSRSVLDSYQRNSALLKEKLRRKERELSQKLKALVGSKSG